MAKHNYTKAEIITRNAKGIEKHEGHAYRCDLGDGSTAELVAYKNDEVGGWYVVDPLVGQSLGPSQKTRAKAVAAAEEQYERYAKFRKTPKYAQLVEELAALIRNGGKPEPKPGKSDDEKRKEAAAKRCPEHIDKDALARSILDIAKDRAAQDPDGKVEGGNASAADRFEYLDLMRADRLVSDAYGDFTSYHLDGEFVCCIERRWSKRKIHLTYPELTPKLHKTDKVAELRAEREERYDGEKIVGTASNGEKVVIAETRHEDVSDEPEEAESWEEELAEGKENAEIGNEVTKMATTAPQAPKAPQAPTAPKPKAEPTVETDVKATDKTMSELEQVKAALEAHADIAVTQKNPKACIWVSGDTKPARDELKELGFRWSRNRKAWWRKPEELKAA